jgi:hypothetical protein
MIKHRPGMWRTIMGLVLFGWSALPVRADDLRVGVGKAEITPAADEFPYRAANELDFVGVHDEIYARALVLDDGKRHAALVVVEETAVPAATELINAISLQMRIPASHVLIAASHTHSVPLFSYSGGPPNVQERREFERVKRGVLEAVRQADEHRQPARIAFGRGAAWINVNNGEQIGSMAANDPRGPSDKTLDVLRFVTPAGAPIALLVNYASHAEVMFRSVTKDHGYEVSGDIPGEVSHLLEAAPAAAPLVLFTSAAEADQLSLFKSQQPAGRLPAADEGAAGWALLDVQSRRLAASIMDVVAGMPLGTAQVRIDADASSVTCPGQQLIFDPNTKTLSADPRPPVHIPLFMVRVDDILLAGVGGDLSSDIGVHFRTASPVAHTSIITMSGESVVYILSDASYEHPGHKLMKSTLAPHCADLAVVDGLVKLINHHRE